MSKKSKIINLILFSIMALFVFCAIVISALNWELEQSLKLVAFGFLVGIGFWFSGLVIFGLAIDNSKNNRGE